MAALLVAMAVMAVLMSAALPVWRHDAQREKEEELVFRGQQYIRAIRLFQTRNRTFPASIDMLVQGRYLRKKFKDPITDEDFTPIPAAGAIPGQGGQTVGGRATPPGPGTTGAPGRGLGSTPTTSSGTSNPFSGSSAMIPGGMIGVVSKSKDESIRLYQGRNHYNEWTFIFVNQAPGGGIGPGGRGGIDPRTGRPFPGGTAIDPRTGRPISGSGTGGTFGTGGPGSGGPAGPAGTGRGVGPAGRGVPFGVPGGIGRGRQNQ